MTPELLCATLRDHWLVGIDCDHQNKTDRPICSCSQWRCDPKPSVGQAVEAWIDHVFECFALPIQSSDGGMEMQTCDGAAPAPTPNVKAGIASGPSEAKQGAEPVKGLLAALHEVSLYGVGATSDTNQMLVVEAARKASLEAERVETLPRDGDDYPLWLLIAAKKSLLRVCEDPTLDDARAILSKIDAAIAEKGATDA